MFKMTCDVAVEGYKPFKVSSFKWKRSIDVWMDTASFIIPGMMIQKQANKSYSNITPLKAFKIGLSVAIYGGYDGENKLLFKGFIASIKAGFPSEVFCEGYYYKLKTILYTFSIGSPGALSSLKGLLETIIDKTEIRISEKMTGQIKLQKSNTPFKNATAADIFTWLQEHYGIIIFFIHDEVYAGLRAAYSAQVAKYRIGWNVVNDEGLEFESTQGSIVRIRMVSRNPDGSKNVVLSTNNPLPGDIKDIKTVITDPVAMQMAANAKQLEYMRYTGQLTGFMVPYVEPGMTAEITDWRFPERNGRYFISGTEGSFGPGGGRQRIKLDFFLGDNSVKNKKKGYAG